MPLPTPASSSTYKVIAKKSRTFSSPLPQVRYLPEGGSTTKPTPLRLVRDEFGNVLKRPPRRATWSVGMGMEVPDGRPIDLNTGELVTDPGRAWELTLGRMPQVECPAGESLSEKADSPAPNHVGKPPSPRPSPSLPRSGYKVKPSLWVTASGTPEQVERQAAAYLRRFDHKGARSYNNPEGTLLGVVSNLRHFYGLSQTQTVSLMTQLFSHKAAVSWSGDGISLAWELVAAYAPSLGVRHPRAKAKRREAEVEEEVTELLAHTRSGGRVAIVDLLALMNEWNPDLRITPRELGHAVHTITGIESRPSKGKRYFSGFHIPTAKDLADPNHWSETGPRNALPGKASGEQTVKLVDNISPLWSGLRISACS